MRKRTIMNVVLICLILFCVVSVRGQFVEGREIQKWNEVPSPSLSKEEIAEEVNKKMRSAFIENQGQVGNEEIVFYGSLPNGKIAFGESKVLLWMEGMENLVTLSFVGAREVLPIGLDEQITKSNYFLSNQGPYTNVRSFGAIFYEDLWKGIDLYYQATYMGAKYEFRVAPGANPEDITISCKGQEQLIIGKDSLTILKGDGRFIDGGLKVFQEGMKIDAKFISKGDNTFGFLLNNYNRKKPLVIDPLIYSTFVGGSSLDSGFSIALDSERNAYVIGNTYSSDFPTTVKAYDRTYNSGSRDCFVFKLSADGSSLLYSTFIGGTSHEYGESIAIDSEGNACVTGYTHSSDFPTTENAYNRTYSNGECFVFKLSANGSSLLYSTFVGGSSNDNGYSIALDSEGNAYVTGETGSSNFPTTGGAYNESYNGEWRECFVFKLSANGSSLLYSTFVGGNHEDRGYSITLDSEGNAYVTGVTLSSNFPTTGGAYNESENGFYDCFVFKLSANGSSLLYSTFVGGSSGDYGRSIALDNEGNAYVTGTTSSSNFPTTIDAYNRTYGGTIDCFVFKLSADGSSLLYSTFIGGDDWDCGYSIALDIEWNAYVTGLTESSNFPTTTGAYDESYNNGDAFNCIVFKLSADGSSLLYSTYVGRGYGMSIALDSEGNAYVTGETFSSDFPTTVGACNESYNGGGDCFVFKLLSEAEIPSTPIPTPTPSSEGGFDFWFALLVVFISMSIFVIYKKKKMR